MQTNSGKPSVMRVHIGDKRIERMADLKSFRQAEYPASYSQRELLPLRTTQSGPWSTAPSSLRTIPWGGRGARACGSDQGALLGSPTRRHNCLNRGSERNGSSGGSTKTNGMRVCA